MSHGSLSKANHHCWHEPHLRARHLTRRRLLTVRAIQPSLGPSLLPVGAGIWAATDPSGAPRISTAMRGTGVRPCSGSRAETVAVVGARRSGAPRWRRLQTANRGTGSKLAAAPDNCWRGGYHAQFLKRRSARGAQLRVQPARPGAEALQRQQLRVTLSAAGASGARAAPPAPRGRERHQCLLVRTFRRSALNPAALHDSPVERPPQILQVTHTCQSGQQAGTSIQWRVSLLL